MLKAQPSRTRAIVRALSILVLASGAALPAQALTRQRLAAEPAIQAVESGGTATVTIVYDSDDLTLAGIAARLHYDSSKLTLESRELLFPAGITGHQDQADAGNAYLAQYDDGDPTTDRRYVGAWADIAAAWPGEGTALPLPLLRLRFRVEGFYPSTSLVVTGSTCSACSLEVRSATVVVSGRGPIQSPTQTPDPAADAVPTAALPTTTPTPSSTPAEPWLDQPPLQPSGGVTVEGIPTLSEIGTLLLILALAGSAVVVLLRDGR